MRLKRSRKLSNFDHVLFDLPLIRRLSVDHNKRKWVRRCVVVIGRFFFFNYPGYNLQTEYAYLNETSIRTYSIIIQIINAFDLNTMKIVQNTYGVCVRIGLRSRYYFGRDNCYYYNQILKTINRRVSSDSTIIVTFRCRARGIYMPT